MDTGGLWSLLGVIAGLLLGEGIRLVRYHWHIRTIRKALKKELLSIKFQIGQKKEIIGDAKKALIKNQILPTKSVRAITRVYESSIIDLYAHISVIERNCLHVIYERLRVADEELDLFEEHFKKGLSENTQSAPFELWNKRFNDLKDSYNVVIELIDSYLNNDCIDVFSINSRKHIDT